MIHFESGGRVANFESKVGSRRTTEIGTLVVLNIVLVALIFITYNMQFVPKMIYVCWEKKRVRMKTSKNLYGQLFSKYFPKNIW